jgi:hypothetical protein
MTWLYLTIAVVFLIIYFDVDDDDDTDGGMLQPAYQRADR